MSERDRKNIGVDMRREIWKNLEEIEEALVDIDGDLRGRMDRGFLDTLPLPVMNWAHQRVAVFASRGWDVSNKRGGIFLDKQKVDIIFKSFQ